MKSIYYITIALSLCAAQSCSRQYTAGLQTSSIKSDSTTIVERLRMDTVTIPGDTIVIEMPVWQACNIPGNAAPQMLTEVKGKRSKASAQLSSNGKLKIVLNCDEYRTAVMARDSIIRRLQSDKQSSSEVKVIERKYIPQIFWYSMVFSCCVLVWWLAKFAMWAYSKWPM